MTTKPGLFPTPLAVRDALSQVEEWVAVPSAQIVAPTARHTQLLGEMLDVVGTGANLVTDAHLAALAREHRASIVTYDRDFARFPGVRSFTPTDLLTT